MTPFCFWLTAGKLFAFNMNNGQSSRHEYPAGIDTSFSVLVRMIQKSDCPDLMMMTASGEFKTFSLISKSWTSLLNFRIQNGTPLSQTVLRSYANGPSGVLWLMDESRDVILRITDDEMREIPFGFKQQSGLEHRIIYRDGFGLIIVNSAGEIYRYTKGMTGPQRVMEVELNYQAISSLHFEGNGDLWITTRDGIVSVDLSTKSARRYDQFPFNGLRPEIHHITEDREGTTWYCSELGLVKVNEQFKSV